MYGFDGKDEARERLKGREERRRFIQTAAAGTVVSALGGLAVVLDDAVTAAWAEGKRKRVPPGQRVIERLKPMGGQPGDPRRSKYRLRVHGEVEHPFSLSFAELVGLGKQTLSVDVHCVTSWSVLDAKFTGVKLKDLAKRAKLKQGVRYVIFEAAHGYTANAPLSYCLRDNVLIAHRLDGRALARAHGGPVRAVVPDLYFWKSAKWLTGIRFARKDEPGYWEQRGYHNRGDPWREERYG